MGTKVRDLQGGYEPLDRRGYENVEKNGYQPQASAVKPTPPQGGTGAVKIPAAGSTVGSASSSAGKPSSAK